MINTVTTPRVAFARKGRQCGVAAVALAALLLAGCGRDDAAQGSSFPGRQGPAFGNAQGTGFPSAQSPSFPNAQGQSFPAQPVFNTEQGQAPGSGQPMAQQPWPQPAQQPQQVQAGFPSNRDEGGRSPLDSLMAWERQDMGVRAPDGLHQGEFHGPTPNQIPGGQVITTKGLLPLLQQGMAVHVFDVLGAQQTLPGAIPAAWAAQPGSFEDTTQQQFGQMLQQVTRGQADAPLVFYCGGPQCWMSYNAAARAIRLGYRNVLWYRGGLEAWQRAGQQAVPAQGRGQGQGSAQFDTNQGS